MAPPDMAGPPPTEVGSGPAGLKDHRLATTIIRPAPQKVQAKIPGVRTRMRVPLREHDAVIGLARTYARLPRRIEQLEDRIDATKDAPQARRLKAHHVADRMRARAALGGDQIAFVRQYGSLTSRERAHIDVMWDTISAGIEPALEQRQFLLRLVVRARDGRP